MHRHAATVLKRVTPMEMRVQMGRDDHSGINKVMLAAALDPWAFRRLPEETTVRLDDV